MFIVPQGDEDEAGFFGRIKELMLLLGRKPLAGIVGEAQDRPEDKEDEDGDS